MFKMIFLSIFIPLSLFANINLTSEQQNILEKLYSENDIKFSYKNRLEIIPYKQGIKQIKSELLYLYYNDKKSLIIFTNPNKMKKKVILSIEKNKWLFFPKISRSIRITNKSNLYGDLVVEDILKYSLKDDYKLKNIENSSSSTILTFIANRDDVYFHKKILVYDNINKRTKTILNYSKSDFLINKLEYLPKDNDIENLKITSNINKNNYTIVRQYPRIKIDTILQRYFKPNNLKKVYRKFIND